MEKPKKCTEKDKENSSTPVEILTEFLSSIMLHDYESASRHCSQILTHEPENSTAKEFYPLILKKLEIDRSRELDNPSDSDNSSYSEADSSSFHHDDDDNTSSSSSSESNLSLAENDDKQGFETKPEQAHVKKEVISSNTAQNQKNLLKTLSKKKLHEPPDPSAQALSTSGTIHGTRTIKDDEKLKMNNKELSSIKTGVKKIENLGHLPKNGILERITFTNRDSQEEKVLITH